MNRYNTPFLKLINSFTKANDQKALLYHGLKRSHFSPAREEMQTQSKLNKFLVDNSKNEERKIR